MLCVFESRTLCFVMWLGTLTGRNDLPKLVHIGLSTGQDVTQIGNVSGHIVVWKQVEMQLRVISVKKL
jgi:hypothetical protein